MVVALLATVALTACAGPQRGGPALVTGEGVRVDREMLAAEVQLLPETQRRAILGQRGRVEDLVSRLYLREAIARAAAERGDLDDPDVTYRLERVRKELLAQIVPMRYLESLERPDFEARARAYYDANTDEFMTEQEVRVAHILLQAAKPEDKARRRPVAEDILRQLQQGAPFAELAKEYSEDASARLGGELASARRGRFVPEFEEAAFGLAEPGDTSGIVESRFGLHIIRLLERVPSEPVPFDDVADRIAAKLEDEWEREQVTAWINALNRPESRTIDDAALTQAIASLRQSYGVAPEVADGQEAASDADGAGRAQENESLSGAGSSDGSAAVQAEDGGSSAEAAPVPQ